MKNRYSQQFRSLVHKMEQKDDPNLKFIGFGNPNAKILLIDSECAINRNTTRGEGCYRMEQWNNTVQWKKNIKKSLIPEDVKDWEGVSIESDKIFNPLYPYKGQINKKAERDNEGCVINGGTKAVWCVYQKLVEKIFNLPVNSHITFHQYVFHTEFSSEVNEGNAYAKNIKESVELRCKELFSHLFFRSFPVVLVTCGRYVKNYQIDIEKTFNQNFVCEEKEDNGWMRIYEKEGRLMIHTSFLTICSEPFLNKVAEKVRKYFENLYLKYCIYYDGTEQSTEEELFAYYEMFWIRKVMMNDPYLVEVVDDLLGIGIDQEWIDHFNIPPSLTGIFFNRYVHWSGFWTKEGFMNWFEKVRSRNI